VIVDTSPVNPSDPGSGATALSGAGLVEATGLARAGAAGHDETIPGIFLALFDVVALVFAFLMTGAMAPWVQRLLLPSGPLRLSLPVWLVLPGGPAEFPALVGYSWVFAVIAPTTLLFLELLGGYREIVDQSRTRLVTSSVLAPLLALSSLTMALFALKIFTLSRVFTFTLGGMSVISLLSYRSALQFYKHRRLRAGAYVRNVVLVGQPPALEYVVEHFRRNVPANRFHLTGWLSVPETQPATFRRAGAEPTQLELPCLATVEDLGAILVHHPFDEVIAVLSAGDSDWLTRVIEACDYFRVRLRIVPEALLVRTLRDLKLVFRTAPLRLPEVVLAPPHIDSDQLLLKRVIDIVASAGLLLLLAPLFLLIAVAIKLTTPHLPVFYPWRVVGLKGRPFTGYKFTTMVAGADGQLGDLEPKNEMRGPVFKLKDDPRVTPIGRFLRKYSLNELPQLWSVLKGDMSLVGPRPAFRHELDRYELWQKRKLCVKPGMTCIWQVSGRNRISDFDQWVKLDLEYIDRWSLWLDFRILVRTVWAVFAGTGS
jgi:exopolysaccharide biosynthesis polyprenyl glycosylphosphotransferase